MEYVGVIIITVLFSIIGFLVGYDTRFIFEKWKIHRRLSAKLKDCEK